MSTPRQPSFADASEWEAWLDRHHADHPEAWIKIAKSRSGVLSVTAAEGTEVALCFGWIDSHRKRCDDTYFLQRYSPRRQGSVWSRANVERAEALIAAGRMRAAGLAEIERARADGRWSAAYESQRTARAPDDLVAALAEDNAAGAFFESLGRTDRYLAILPVLKARSAEARETQLRRVLDALRTGRRVG